MKRILYVCCLLSLAACNNKKPETAQTYLTTPTGIQGIQQSAAKTVQTGNTGALNPAHGAPGHRCDLAVGAPLNSSPTKAVTTVPQQTATPPPVAQPVENTATIVHTSGQLNPKHGEPNHRCDIAVGAPLNAKSSNVTTAPQTTTKVTATPVAKAATAAVPMFNEKGQRLNPAHGKPGHKCEIAVGAPLT